MPLLLVRLVAMPTIWTTPQTNAPMMAIHANHGMYSMIDSSLWVPEGTVEIRENRWGGGLMIGYGQQLAEDFRRRARGSRIGVELGGAG